MTWGQIADAIAGGLFVGGCFLSFAAGIGVLRFPDLLARIHAGAKPQVLGVLLALAGLALRLRSWSAAATLLLIAMFQMLTAPVSAHLLARAAYRTGKFDSERLVIDELTADRIALDERKPTD